MSATDCSGRDRGGPAYVVPVALALLQRRTRKFKRPFPSPSLGGVLGQRKLAGIIVPRANEMGRLDIGGGAESEAKLSCSHYDER